MMMKNLQLLDWRGTHRHGLEVKQHCKLQRERELAEWMEKLKLAWDRLGSLVKSKP